MQIADLRGRDRQFALAQSDVRMAKRHDNKPRGAARKFCGALGTFSALARLMAGGSRFLGALAVAGLLSACDGSSEQGVGKFIGRAQEQLAKGDRDAALIELKNALQRDPASGEARLLLGQLYVDAGLGPDAEAELLKAQAAGMGGIELELALARARLLVGSYQSVLDQISSDLVLDSTKARELYISRGEALMGLRRLDEAVTLFERVLTQENLARAHGGLARIAIVRGEYDKADQHLKDALALEPDRSEWLALSGEALLDQERYAEARAVFERFVAKDKTYAAGQLGYVRALIGAGDLDKAREWVADLQRMAPQDLRLIMMSGIVDLEQGNFPSAKKSAETVLAGNEDNAQALYVAGVSSYRLEDYEAANRYLTQYSLKNTSRDLRPLFYLSATKYRLGYAKEAFALLQSNPRLVEQSAAAMDLLAQAAVKSGNFDAGIAYLEQLAERRPNDAQTQARLGLVRVASGDGEAGIDALEKAVEQDPKLDAVAQRLVLELVRAGKLDEALAAAQKLVDRNPDRATGYILQGIVMLQKGGLGTAEQYFRKAWEVEPGNASAGLNLAQIEISRKNDAAAISILSKVIEQSPGQLQALLFLADLEGRSGNPDRQEKLLRDAIEANPDSTQARVLLARHLLQRNRAGEAQAVLQPAIQPDLKASSINGALLESAAAAAMMQNNPSQALEYLTQLLKLQPNSLQAHFLSGQAHAALGELSQAEAQLRQALTINSDHYESIKALAAILQRQGRYEDSLAQLAIARKLRATDPVLMDMEARAHLAAKRWPDAIAAAKQALDLAPKTERLVALAQLYWNAGQKEQAIAALQNWVELKPDDAAAQIAFASQLLEAGRVDEALQHYDAAARLQPNNALAANDYAWVLWKSGKKDQALAEGERALKLAPNDPRVQDTLGTILIEMGPQDRALNLLQASAAAMPENPSIQYHLALVYHKAGQPDRASEVLKAVLASSMEFAERGEAQQLLDSLNP